MSKAKAASPTIEKYSVGTSDGAVLYADSYSVREARGTFLLVHGVTSSSASWRCFRQFLATLGYSSVAYDARGHADSDKDDDLDYSMRRLSLDAVEVAESFGLERPILCGVSLGGAAVLGWATGALVDDAPPITGLVLASTSPRFFNLVFPRAISPNVGLSAEALHAILKNDLKAFGATATTNACASTPAYEAMLAESARVSATANLKALTAILKRALSYDVTKRLRDISVPTLVVHGGTDELFPFDSAVYMYRAIPGAQLAGIPNRGHYVIATDAETFNSVVRNYLGGDCEVCVE
jgi:pimeloyl-ACP methyl ester carboxylesterase